MTNAAKLPSAAYHIVPKRAGGDCAVASLAMILRRSYEEVLLAAAHVDKHVLHNGLSSSAMVKVCRRFGLRARWHSVRDLDTDIGVLWVSYRDSTREHAMPLIEGWVYDVDHDPVPMWPHDDFMAANNAVARSLLVVAG